MWSHMLGCWCPPSPWVPVVLLCWYSWGVFWLSAPQMGGTGDLLGPSPVDEPVCRNPVYRCSSDESGETAHREGSPVRPWGGDS